jgi:hypothetical protein
MAAPVALNAAFMQMGFSQEASAILADVNKENLTIASLQYLDDKGIKTLCASLCKPGRAMAGPVPAGGGVAFQIPNPGVYVSTRAEMNMEAVCYLARHFACTTWTMEAGDITLVTIQTLTQCKEVEEA